jgi:hypothetical protein
MRTWTWDAPTGETIDRPALYRRCAALCAQGIRRGMQLDPVRTAAAMVMHEDPDFDLASAVSVALGPFYDAYPLGYYDEATAVSVLLTVADRLDAEAVTPVRWDAGRRTPHAVTGRRRSIAGPASRARLG